MKNSFHTCRDISPQRQSQRNGRWALLLLFAFVFAFDIDIDFVSQRNWFPSFIFLFYISKKTKQTTFYYTIWSLNTFCLYFCNAKLMQKEAGSNCSLIVWGCKQEVYLLLSPAIIINVHNTTTYTPRTPLPNELVLTMAKNLSSDVCCCVVGIDGSTSRAWAAPLCRLK